MALLGKMKLQKVTFKAYDSIDRNAPVGSFEAMYNPESFSQRYEIEYSTAQALNSSGKPAGYVRNKSNIVKLKLILDGTGVHEMGVFQLLARKSVSTLVSDFIKLAFHLNGEKHEPNYLVVEWGGKQDGGLNFDCRLSSVDVTYTTFDRDGSPLRAELDIELVSDLDRVKRVRIDNMSSPDLTHTRVVHSGDTLALLCKEIYGSSRYYLKVAEVNNLDNFRNLAPGQTLIFPPLEN